MPTKKCIYLFVILSIFQLLIIFVVVVKEKHKFLWNVKHNHSTNDDKNQQDEDEDDDENNFKALEALLEAESRVTSHHHQTKNHNDYNDLDHNVHSVKNFNKRNRNNTKCLLINKVQHKTDENSTNIFSHIIHGLKFVLNLFKHLFIEETKSQIGDEENLKHQNNQTICDDSHRHLIGSLPVQRILTFKDSLTSLKNLEKGGVWSPKTCKHLRKVVLIVPYRNRTEHLKAFLRYIHWFMQWQRVDYRVVVVEQMGQAMFNRGMLMNIGFTEVNQLQHVDCAIFHDVDLLPENDKIFYRCGRMPKHMSVAVSSFHYKLPYLTIFGGVEAFTVDQFKSINGFSNTYFGWGGEDDDLYKRVYLHRMEVSRDQEVVARYHMLGHQMQPKNPTRFELLKQSTTRFQTDGLNSLLYNCLIIEERPFYTRILVNLDEMFEKQSQPTSSANT